MGFVLSNVTFSLKLLYLRACPGDSNQYESRFRLYKHVNIRGLRLVARCNVEYLFRLFLILKALFGSYRASGRLTSQLNMENKGAYSRNI